MNMNKINTKACTGQKTDDFYEFFIGYKTFIVIKPNKYSHGEKHTRKIKVSFECLIYCSALIRKEVCSDELDKKT